MSDGHLSGHQPDGPAGPWRAVEASTSCPCGLPVQQPWRTRDDTFSPASFIGGLIWYAVLAGALLGEFSLFSWILGGVLIVSLAGSLVVQAIRHHKSLCWLRRSLWFGVATPGLPVRIVSAFSV